MDSVLSDDSDDTEDELGLDIHHMKSSRGNNTEKMSLLTKYTDTPDGFDADMDETDI